MRRYVNNQNPLFDEPSGRRDGVFPYRESAYYFWWESLRRSDDYRAAFDLGDKAEAYDKFRPIKQIVDDFGDVWNTDFEDWWNAPVGDEKRGEYLFAEPLVEDGVRRLSKAEAEEFVATWDQKHYMLLAVPIALYSEDFIRKSGAIYADRYELKGQERPASRARYQFSGNVRTQGMALALAVYDSHKQEPDTELWVHVMRWDPAYTGLDRTALEGSKHLTERQSLSRKGSRAKQQAEQMIEAVAQGTFPRLTPQPTPSERRAHH